MSVWPPISRRSSGQERSARSSAEGIGSGGFLARAEPELVRPLLHGGDHVRDVLVEVHAQLLGALAHLVAVHARRERWLLELLLHGLGRQADDPGGADHRAGRDEARQLVYGEQRLRHPRFTWYAQERGVPRHGVDQLLRVAELLELLQGDARMAGLEI